MVELSDFLRIIQGLQSSDNDARNQAETAYDTIAPSTRLILLLNTVCNDSCDIEIRTMSSVLFRRLMVNQYDQAFDELPEDQKILVKTQLLNCLSNPSLDDKLRKKIADVVAELARNLVDNDGRQTWSEVLEFLHKCICAEQCPGLRYTALHIFGAVPSIYGEEQSTRLGVIHDILLRGLVDSDSEVRFAAVKALSSFLVACDGSPEIFQPFRDLLMPMLQGIADSVRSNEEDSLLKCLVDVAETAHKFLRPQLENAIDLCMKILNNTELDDTLRHLALEVIVTLAENAPASVRKVGKFLPGLVHSLLMMMTDLEDDPEWAVQDELEQEDEMSNAINGETALDRLACGLGGRTMLPFILQTVPPMLNSEDWKARHAALMAVSACGEGCHKQMENMLSSIIPSILPFLRDPHPRVRYACCNAIGQMSTDFAKVLQKKFHAAIIPELLTVLEDSSFPRVQAHAGAALVNFSESCPKSILANYLDTLMDKLVQTMNFKLQELMQKGTKLVMEQLVTTLASIADTVEERFETYYDRFMPALKYILQSANAPNYRLLRGKTIECISLIGLAVGKGKFLADASEVMNLLLKSQQEDDLMQSDDPHISFMISAWARMCKIMGADFQPYLQPVMPAVLKAAQIKPDMQIMDNEELDTIDLDPEWQYIRLGEDQNFAIRTSGLDDKANACQMLVCYARELKEGFAPYVDEVATIMLPLLKFYFNDEVREAASEIMPFLLDCGRSKGEEYVQKLWHNVCPALLQAIASEPDNDNMGEHLLSLAHCVDRMGHNCMNAEELQSLAHKLDRLFNAHFERHEQRLTKRQDEDYDEVEEERMVTEKEGDEYVLSKLSDVLHSLFGAYKADILPFFQGLVHHIIKLIENGRPYSDHQWGLCIWDDVIEHAGPASWQYKDAFLPTMLQAVGHVEPDVRQAALYGIGVMAMCGGPDYTPILRQVLPTLVAVVTAEGSRSDENVSATENAISAVCKIAKYRPDAIPEEEANANALLEHWFSWLPVWEDREETGHVYGFLCDLIEMNHAAVLGENNCKLPRVVRVLAECFQQNGLEPESPTRARCVNILRTIQANEAFFSACLSELTESQRATLQEVMSSSN